MNTDDDNQSIDLDDLDFDEEDIKQLDEAVTTYLQTQQTQQRPWDQKAAATQDGQRQASTYHTIAAGYVTDGPFVKQEPDDKQDSRRIIEDLQHRIQALEFDKQMLERKLNEQTKREKIVSEAEQILTKKKKRTNPGTPTITHSPAVAGTQQLPPSNRGSTQTSFPTVAPAWKPKNRRKRAESPHSAFSLSNETSKMTLHSQMRAAPQGDEEDDHAISTATVVPTTHDVKSCSASGMVLPDHAESSRLYKDGPSLSQTQRTSTSMSIEEEPPLKIAKVPVKQADDPYSALNGTPSFRSITSTPTTPFIPFPSNEAYRDLLQLIFEDIYLEWNRTRHKYTKNYLMAFTPENIQQWSEQYASYFTDIPSTLTLDKIHEQRLNMIASEIRYYLSGQIQDANVIIRSLIIQFGYCLPICIQYKLYTIIECISMTLARITASWHQAVQQQQQQQQQQHQQQFHTVALQQLYNEMISHRSHAVLYQLVQCLSLFTFKYHNDRKPSPLKQQIITEKYADLLREDITYTEIMTLVNQHQTYPSVINAAIEAKLTPKEAYSTKSIQCILEVLTRVSRQYPNKPMYVYLSHFRG
ncbi:hypothetical protein BDF20DRAFT_227877 [Mycotypha africana]|uniref:uncharacterized protein n=1 Tax=Mycotypha africana TaxID=64632 RepID=UPI0023006666|nr:uncharacterized protein BDF20DRAFT_227877 [Mycotypha africana]KAI8967632.1 hypothetical protein BDF20DRAFT_227877 [Mycotypha africana]